MTEEPLLLALVMLALAVVWLRARSPRVPNHRR